MTLSLSPTTIPKPTGHLIVALLPSLAPQVHAAVVASYLLNVLVAHAHFPAANVNPVLHSVHLSAPLAVHTLHPGVQY